MSERAWRKEPWSRNALSRHEKPAFCTSALKQFPARKQDVWRVCWRNYRFNSYRLVKILKIPREADVQQTKPHDPDSPSSAANKASSLASGKRAFSRCHKTIMSSVLGANPRTNSCDLALRGSEGLVG